MAKQATALKPPKKLPAVDRYMTFQEAAEFLSASVTTIRILTRLEVLPVYYVTDAMPRVKMSEIEEYLRRKRK